jgi:prepilin peptidase CpaA
MHVPVMNPMIYFLFAAVVFTGIAAWTDSRTGHIPNAITLTAFVVGVVFHLVVGWRAGGFHQGIADVGWSLAGAVFCSIVPGFMYWRGAIGGGDLKLFAALGALLMPLVGIEVETYAFVAAALIAPAKLAYQGVLLQTLGRSLALVINPFRKAENRREIPQELMTWFRLGPAIFVGTAVTVLMHWGLP